MRVIVGMSGGVDSSLAAALLQQQGHEVIGVTLQLYAYQQTLEQTDEDKRNCHPDAFLNDARNVAKHLGIEHHVLDQQALFQSTIIDTFMKAYQAGQTPVPCVTCNRDVKTAVLYQCMKDMGADALATGHYVRRVDVDGLAQLHQGADGRRDQSFFLFALTLPQLKVLHFPLGTHSKEDTRVQAAALGLPTAAVPASQDLCFIAKKSYKTLFADNPGDIVTADADVVGQHRGVTHYTIGQRQGLGLGGAHNPLYVIGLDVARNQVIVGPKEALACDQLVLKDVSWLAIDKGEWSTLTDRIPITVKIRSSGNCLPAQLRAGPTPGTALVDLGAPEYGVSAGQACVFYDGTRVLGGGWIDQGIWSATLCV